MDKETGGNLVIAGAAEMITSVDEETSVIIVSSGQTFGNVTISSGTDLTVSSGGITTSIILDGGMQYIEYSGIANNTSIMGGIQYVYASGTANNTTILGGVQYVIGGGATATNAGVANNTIISGGEEVIAYGGVLNSATIYNGGLLYIAANGTASGNIVLSSGGGLIVASKGVISGEITLNPGGVMSIGLSNGGSIDLLGNENSGLTISGYAATGSNQSITTVISGFSGTDEELSDKITINGLEAANISAVTYPDDDHITLELLDGNSLTLNMVGIKQTGYSLEADASGNVIVAVCFLSGTIIKMASGEECAVENIQVGDIILTKHPKTNKNVAKKVIWVGKQHICVNPEMHDDLAGYPVRILKNSFQENIPNKDLLITPEHCLFIDGYFIPVRMLVNGRSIVYDYSMQSYDYYHIETEDHSIIWADGVLTESYLNTGNRHQFSDNRSIIPLDVKLKNWEQDAAAPLMVASDVVESIYRRIYDRAIQMRIEERSILSTMISNNPEFFIITNQGKVVHQLSVEDDGGVVFALPPHTASVRLISRKSRPCDLFGPFIDDRRELGMLIGKITLSAAQDITNVTVHLHNELLKGWWNIEQQSCRWTNGDALLPLPEYHAINQTYLTINILQAGPYIINNTQEQKIA